MFPAYLFADREFWAFLALNCVGVLYLAYLAGNCLMRYGRVVPVRLLPGSVAVALLIASGYQFFHHIEHAAQVHQFIYLRQTALHSQGILWFFDFEWNHFVFNAGYFALLAYALSWLIRWQWQTRVRLMLAPVLLLLAVVTAWEGWHLAEHMVKITRHLALGCEPCPGIVDRAFGVRPIVLHYWYNLVALFLTEVVFFALGAPQRAWRWLKTRLVRATTLVLQGA